ncbi:hypothetical protein N0V84_010574 [Fusarium piperis]|uniref:Uncharacterized protein n=1 Tax=Fusarium piperis TaxID=1435070 RepID=A0A9W8TFW6_9HYPO|nr:hypothetical protein N0V84_010574 [Fusarium piperis]
MASNGAKGKQPDFVGAVSGDSREKRMLSPVAESRPVNRMRKLTNAQVAQDGPGLEGSRELVVASSVQVPTASGLGRVGGRLPAIGRPGARGQLRSNVRGPFVAQVPTASGLGRVDGRLPAIGRPGARGQLRSNVRGPFVAQVPTASGLERVDRQSPVGGLRSVPECEALEVEGCEDLEFSITEMSGSEAQALEELAWRRHREKNSRGEYDKYSIGEMSESEAQTLEEEAWRRYQENDAEEEECPIDDEYSIGEMSEAEAQELEDLAWISYWENNPDSGLSSRSDNDGIGNSAVDENPGEDESPVEDDYVDGDAEEESSDDYEDGDAEEESSDDYEDGDAEEESSDDDSFNDCVEGDEVLIDGAIVDNELREEESRIDEYIVDVELDGNEFLIDGKFVECDDTEAKAENEWLEPTEVPAINVNEDGTDGRFYSRVLTVCKVLCQYAKAEESWDSNHSPFAIKSWAWFRKTTPECLASLVYAHVTEETREVLGGTVVNPKMLLRLPKPKSNDPYDACNNPGVYVYVCHGKRSGRMYDYPWQGIDDPTVGCYTGQSIRKMARPGREGMSIRFDQHSREMRRTIPELQEKADKCSVNIPRFYESVVKGKLQAHPRVVAVLQRDSHMAALATLIETVVMLLTGSVSPESSIGQPTLDIVIEITRELQGTLTFQPKPLNKASRLADQGRKARGEIIDLRGRNISKANQACTEDGCKDPKQEGVKAKMKAGEIQETTHIWYRHPSEGENGRVVCAPCLKAIKQKASTEANRRAREAANNPVRKRKTRNS